MQALAAAFGATGVAVAGGLVLGASVPTTPIISVSDPFDTIPQHEAQVMSAEEMARRTPDRDQFPLETEHGVIPVQELSLYGRRASRMRDMPLYGARTYDEAYGLTARYETGHGGNERIIIPAAQQAPHTQPLDGQREAYVPLEPGIFDGEDTPRDGPAVVKVSTGYSKAG